MSSRYLSDLDESRLPSFESFVAGLNADKLKVLARELVGKDAYKMNKAACFAAVRAVLQDDESIGAMVRRLPPLEQWALSIVKVRGGRVAPTEELAAELLMFDASPARGRQRYGLYGEDNRYARLNGLLDRGLLIRADGRSSRLDRYYSCPLVVADPRMLAHVEVAAPVILTIPVAGPGARVQHVKRQSGISLQMIALGQAIASLGGLPLTAAGLRAKPGVTKLGKVLGEKLFSNAGPPSALADPLGFYLSLWDAAGLFTRRDGKLSLKERAWDDFAERPIAEQASVWVGAYRGICEWTEHVPPGVYLSESAPSGPTKLNGLRAALVVALAALPDAHAWYRVADLSDAIHQRLGAFFSLGYGRGGFSASYRESPYEADRKRAAWEQEDLKKWRACEGAWIAHAIAGPLYHLGLVELACADDKHGALPDLFRLSDAGRSGIYETFRPGRMPGREERAIREPSTEPCWVVQPNFDVVVYLDRAAPQQIKFIERVGVRQHVGDAVATYRLTRESTYDALESGVSIEVLLRTLARGNHHPLPAGVARCLADWAAGRERLAVHLGARVIEFDDASTRDAALAAGEIAGRPVGGRFVLVERLGRTFVPTRIVSYDPSPPRCLSVGEAGVLSIDARQRDLLIERELAEYAEPDAKDGLRWRVTQRSMQAAVRSGVSSADVVKRLSRRAGHALPPILVFAIRAWAGDTAAGALAVPSVEILQVGEAELADAIAKSRALRQHLSARLGPTAFLVKPEHVGQLRQELTALGLPPERDLLPAGCAVGSGSSTADEQRSADAHDPQIEVDS